MTICLWILLLTLSASRLSPEHRTETDDAYLVVVVKQQRRLELYRIDRDRRQLVRSYPIALGSSPIGHKKQQGDGATPEGDYYVTHKNPRSKFHLSLGLSYPNLADADSGLLRGLISKREHQQIVAAIRHKAKPPQRTALGGDIFLHGGGVDGDWTAGCIALDNHDIEELFSLLPLRTPVTILP